jgi:hypothetical protein
MPGRRDDIERLSGRLEGSGPLASGFLHMDFAEFFF